MDKYLALWLEGPMQSYGIDSKFYNRSTEIFPSKSAIIGIILSAMGKGGSQVELLSSFKGLSQTIIAYENTQNKCPVRLRDFHMVGSGYNDKDEWQNLMIPKKTDGTKSSTASKLTHRYYLQDVAFGVMFQLPEDEDLKRMIIKSIQNPIWDTFLGRKNCAPTEFLYQGVFKSEKDCEEKFKSIIETKTYEDRYTNEKRIKYKEKFRVYDKEVEHSEKVGVNDVPIDFSIHKKYEARNIFIVR